MTKKTILIVDDEPNNLQLLKNVLSPVGYNLKFATDGVKALNAVEKHKPDLILLDIMMPNMDGYEVCIQLKKNPHYTYIPVIFVTAMGEEIDEARGFEVGCVDYIQKPITPSIVIARVKTHLSLIRMNILEQLVEESINMLGEAGHFNDTDTGKHIIRISAYSGLLAKHAGWKDDDIQAIRSASTLHDTGKIGIPDKVLKAPRRLNKEEWKIMKSHSQIGSDILSISKNPVFQMAAEIALNHHERFDGKGYPTGLVGDAIPESARIVAIVDVFDALTSKRPYKEPWPVQDAIDELVKESGKHFDPKLIQLFIDHLDEFMEIKNHS